MEVQTEAELEEACAFARAKELPILVLGGGSNVLVPDEGVSAVVIKNAITGIDATTTDSEVQITVGAGEVFDDLVSRTVSEGWWGLENLSHIPGTVGATPVQNVGAYGVEMADLIVSVRVYDYVNQVWQTLSAHDCQFDYRTSLFKTDAGANYIITYVTFILRPTPSPTLTYRDLEPLQAHVEITTQQVRDAVIEIRSKKFPDWTQVGTAGSFFKNPIIEKSHYTRLCEAFPCLPGYEVGDDLIKVPLGYVLDKVCHIKGTQHGKVGTYDAQALVLIAERGATANDVIAFAKKITQTVFEKTNITIEWEVTRW